MPKRVTADEMPNPAVERTCAKSRAYHRGPARIYCSPTNHRPALPPLHMKIALPLLMTAALALGAMAQAEPSASSPLAGTWTVDVSRLPIPPEARPQQVTIRFAEVGAGQWSTTVDVVDAGGGKHHAAGTYTLDGTPSPVAGNLEADVGAAVMPVPGVLVMQLARGGVPASTRIYAAAADGKSMIETATYFSNDGRPVFRTNYFSRVQ